MLFSQCSVNHGELAVTKTLVSKDVLEDQKRGFRHFLNVDGNNLDLAAIDCSVEGLYGG